MPPPLQCRIGARPYRHHGYRQRGYGRGYGRQTYPTQRQWAQWQAQKQAQRRRWQSYQAAQRKATQRNEARQQAVARYQSARRASQRRGSRRG